MADESSDPPRTDSSALGGAPGPVLIVVTGHPGSGKTAFSRRLARRPGRAAYQVMDYFVGAALAPGISLIAESNLPAIYYRAKFAAWRERYRFAAVQAPLFADPVELERRMRQRASQGRRHAVHGNALLDPGYYRAALGTGRIKPLALPGELIEFDTSDVAAWGSGAACELVAAALARAARS